MSIDLTKEFDYFTKNTTNYYYKYNDQIKGNEFRKNDKKGKYIVITFVDVIGNNISAHQRIQNIYKVRDHVLKNNPFIDEFKIYRLSDVDEDFKKKSNLINHPVYFPWIAKTYFIKKKLFEIDEDDILFYIDSDFKGLESNGTEKIFSMCENSMNGIVGFHSNFWLEKFFTKKKLFEKLGLFEDKYMNTNQAYGGICLLKKTNFAIKIVDEWFELCQDEELFNNDTTNNEHTEFITHKNDQSMFSLLLKKYNVKTFPLPLKNMDKNDIIAKHSGYFMYDNEMPLIWEDCWNVPLEVLFNNSKSKFRDKITIPESTMSISIDYCRKQLNKN